MELGKKLLRAILTDDAVMDHVVTSVVAEDFLDAGHAQIWNAMLELYRDRCPIDTTTVLAALTEQGIDVPMGMGLIRALLPETSPPDV